MEDLRINKIPSQYFSYGNPAGGWSDAQEGEGAQMQNSVRARSLSPRARDVQPIDTDQELLRRRDVFGNVHAPFGTEQTPPLKVKIIGGRYVTVLERPPPSSRDIEPLRAPNGPTSTRLHEMLTPRDSMAQRELGRPPPLPPIPQGSSRRATVEGPVQQQEVIVRDFAYKMPPAGVSTARGQHLPLPPIGDAPPEAAVHALAELLRKLPHDRYLPSSPINIDSMHYVALLHELEQQLSHVTANTLQQVYIELTTFDRSLSGEVKFNDLSLVFSRNSVFLKPEILRLLGALFVASAEGGVGTKVNYEKIVSFLSACLKFFAEKKQRHLLVDGAELPPPPFELLAGVASQLQSNAQSHSLMDSGLGSTGPPHPPPPPPQHLPDRETVQRAMQGAFNFPPPPHHPPCPKCHSENCQCAANAMQTMREQFEQHRPQLPDGMPEKLRLELMEKMREGPPPLPLDFGQSAREEDAEAKKAREEAEFSHYLQLATEQLVRSRRPFDTEALRLQFQRADRIMRGTLSVGQIVELTQQSGIPLEPSLVADIVRNLCPHRGGGQYDWLAFQSFVDKLKPQQTSLNVGSMRPDRVLTVREPLPTWPYADPGSMPRLAQPENRDEDHEPPKYYQSMPAEMSFRAMPEKLRLTQVDSLRRNLETEYQNQPVPDLAVAGNRSGAVANLLEQFQLTARSKGGKWMERFMQLAAAVYESVDAQGFSKPSMARHTTRKYADTLRLMIADIDIDDALRYARTVDGRVDTHLYLKRLCRNKLDG